MAKKLYEAHTAFPDPLPVHKYDAEYIGEFRSLFVKWRVVWSKQAMSRVVQSTLILELPYLMCTSAPLNDVN